MKLRFLGGAGTVTGSRYLLEWNLQRVLIDCGLFQGIKQLRLKNWEPFPVPANEISAVFLTHAHLDHSGYLPRLLNEGFMGKIFCSKATADLCRILLLDSAKIQEEDAWFANRRKYSKHHPALPLYTTGDALAVLARFVTVEFSQPFQYEGCTVQFSRVGHILGAAAIKFTRAKVNLTFTGDVGRMNDPVMLAPERLSPTNYLVVESTYGDRRHPKTDPACEIKESILEVEKSAGALLIPAFTVGRAQQVMYEISQLKIKNAIPDIPVFLDSPMATSVTDIYLRYPKEHRLGRKDLEAMSECVKYIRTPEESKSLNDTLGPRIIISASGMATGGRVLFHLENLAGDARNQILFVGFQAAGTRGASLIAGSDEIKIHGHYVRVAAKIKNLESLSAHADFEEILDWMIQSQIHPKRVFICHGEPAASDGMRRRIEERLQLTCTVPQIGDAWELI